MEEGPLYLQKDLKDLKTDPYYRCPRCQHILREIEDQWELQDCQGYFGFRCQCCDAWLGVSVEFNPKFTVCASD